MDDLHIKDGLKIPGHAMSVDAVRGSGPGGQSVNKTNSAAQLRAYIDAFDWPDALVERIFRHNDNRISEAQRAVVIQCDTHRSFHRNLDEARGRLQGLMKAALHRPKRRRKTRPSRSAVRRAIKKQKRRSKIKSLRGRVKRSDWQG